MRFKKTQKKQRDKPRIQIKKEVFTECLLKVFHNDNNYTWTDKLHVGKKVWLHVINNEQDYYELQEIYNAYTLSTCMQESK